MGENKNKQLENKEEINQTKEFYGEEKPNSLKLLTIITIIIIVMISLAILFLPYGRNKNDNQNIITPNDDATSENENTNDNQNITTSNDDVISENENSNDAEENTINNINLQITPYEVTGVKYILNLEQFIKEQNYDIYPKYLQNGEKKQLEVGDTLSLENGKVSYDAWGTLYNFDNFNNIEKAAGYFSAQDGATIYFITKDKKAYMTSQTDDFKTMIEFKIEKIEEIIITEYCGESCDYEGAIIKTTDQKYFIHTGNQIYEDGLKELVVNENKIEQINQEPQLVNLKKEIIRTEDNEPDNDFLTYDITSENPYHTSDYALNGEIYTEIRLNNGKLNIYTSEKVFTYNNPEIEKYIVVDSNEEVTDFSIFFVTKQKEIYRIYINNDKLISFIKFDIKDVESVGRDFEDEEDRKIWVKTKNKNYILDYKEDNMYDVKIN